MIWTILSMVAVAVAVGVPIAYYVLQDKPWVKKITEFINAVRAVIAGFVEVIVDSVVVRVLVIGFVAFGVWGILNEMGWIPHHQITVTYIGENTWTPGEYRDCIAIPTKEGTLAPYRPGFSGYLVCAEYVRIVRGTMTPTPHELDITYWGRIERRDMADIKQPTEWRWHCRRNESSVTCWAVN